MSKYGAPAYSPAPHRVQPINLEVQVKHHGISRISAKTKETVNMRQFYF